jgi:hypothetical protein
MRTTKLACDLANVARRAIGEQVERGDLRQRKVARCKLASSTQHEFAPEAANRNYAPADLTEALATACDLIVRRRKAARSREPTAQPVCGTAKIGEEPPAARWPICMHVRT